MSATEVIAAALEGHRFHYDLTIAAHACSCGEWRDSGPSARRVRHNYEEHLAGTVAAALDLREETGQTTRCKCGHSALDHGLARCLANRGSRHTRCDCTEFHRASRHRLVSPWLRDGQ